MATTGERIEELLDGARRNRRVLVTPEGVPLDLTVAGCGERAVAFAIDCGLILAGVVALSIIADAIVVRDAGDVVARTLAQFLAFLLRTFYFTYFELMWQGATPGKRRCGLRVVNRDGGELTSGAIIARNLLREAEFFLPLALLFRLDADGGLGRQLSLAGWAMLFASLPLWNRDRLRAGDIIAGTQVIAMPKRVLSADLSVADAEEEAGGYVFTREQLSKYGAFELQVLEEILRRPSSPETDRLLEDVGARIRRKIGWTGAVAPEETRRFLIDFYAAERGDLERGKLFGRMREDKNAPVRTGRNS